ncbi:MAG: hypothetical protein JO021_00510 [Alphaproteobacteria bacterium]|nr:hypothetical protein [Alphaproteobacteria bacterium]
MVATRHKLCALLLAPGLFASGWLAAPQASAQTTQPSPEAFALYDQLVDPVTARAGLGAAPPDDNVAAACRRQAIAVEVMIRFAIGATLAPGTTLDSGRAENRREAVEMMVGDARATLTAMAGQGATAEQCRTAARTFGASALTFAQAINRNAVQRSAQALMPPPKAPGPPERTEEEMAAEEAAKAESDRLQAAKEEAERLAKDKADHAFANLRPVAPVARTNRAQPLTFNIYLVDTPAMREAKDFKLCFEPGLYQRAAKPIVDLAAAVLEVPDGAPVVGGAVTDFLAKLGPILAKRLDFPANRLTLENTDGDAVRGPAVELVKAVSAGCHLYAAGRPPTIAHDDGTTTLGLVEESVLEDVVLRPALETRLAALGKLDGPVTPAAVAEGAPPPPAPRPDVVACAADARCRAGVRVAVNACQQVAERRLGKAAIARELEVRQRVTALQRAKPDDDAVAKEFDLVSGNLELIDGTLNQLLERLAKAAPGLRQQGATLLTSQELDAALTAGRTEGEQSMGTPVLQCQARLADGRAIGLTATR